jgi:O-antigen/teichoic acid export membrane protein
VASAQLIAMLVMPLITRIYSPNQFAVLAVFTALLNILGSVACLRFEIAIPLPERQADGEVLVTLSLLSTLLISALTTIILAFYGRNILSHFSEGRLLEFLWMIPVSVFFIGIYQAFRYYSIRIGRFASVAKNRIIQVVGCATVQISMGLLGLGAIGLLLGQLFNQSAGVIGLSRKTDYWLNFRDTLSFQRLSEVFQTFSRFPKYSVLETLANNLGSQAPILIIGVFAESSEVAYLSLAIMAISAPMGLLGNSLSQAFLSKAASEFRMGRLHEFSLDAVNLLFKLCGGPILCAGILAPTLFPIVFGESWARSGVIVSWMTGAFLMQIVTSPISILLHVTSNQKIALGLQLFGAFIRIVPVWLAAKYYMTFTVEAFALASAFFYLVYFIVICRVAEIRLNDCSAVTRSLKFVGYWIIFGSIVLMIFVLLKHISHFA